jgi:hypothetical protein
MKRAFTIILLLIFSSHTFGWGPTGHRTTGWVADKYLNKKARKALERILSGQSLAITSTWMDDVRSDAVYNHMTDWHFVTIPFGQTYDQTTKNPKGDIIQTLERVIAELKSKKLTDAEQLERIKILIHLVGDIHQPLHVGGKDDKGGNDIKLTWFGDDSNLHRVWDSEMIDGSKLSYTELGMSLNKPTEAELKAWQKNSIREWAAESQTFEKQVYDIGDGKLGYKYSYLYFSIVRQRLLQAGVRLAGVLNDIYGK